MIARAIATISASRSLSTPPTCAARTSSASAQHEERHAGAARLDRDHPLAPAERETPEPDDACLGHRRADDPQRFLRHRAIRGEVIGGVEVDGIEVTPRHKLFKVDDR